MEGTNRKVVANVGLVVIHFGIFMGDGPNQTALRRFGYHNTITSSFFVTYYHWRLLLVLALLPSHNAGVLCT
jgi:hypothetical protein